MKPVDPKRLAQMKKLVGRAGGGGPAGYMDPKTGKLRPKKLPPTFEDAVRERARRDRLIESLKRTREQP